MTESASKSGDAALEAFGFEFRRYKRQAERVFEQLADGDFFRRLNDEQNSIYVIVKHMAGNMRSRFTDFLTSDGEKPDRDRDSEFVDEVVPREQVMATWERGWGCVFDALSAMKGEDLSRTVTVRGEGMTVASAIARQVAHYAYHVGQITLLGKHFVGKDWKYITIPRGGSAEFIRAWSSVRKREALQHGRDARATSKSRVSVTATRAAGTCARVPSSTSDRGSSRNSPGRR